MTSDDLNCCQYPKGEKYRIEAARSDTWIMRVVKGQGYRFATRGTWIDWFIRTDADGYDSRMAALFNLWPDLPLKPLMALCGRLTSEDGRVHLFLIGKERDWTAPFDGALSVFANDITSAKWFRNNNQGAIDLWISETDRVCTPPGDADMLVEQGGTASTHGRNAVSLRNLSLFGLWRQLVKAFHRTEGILLISGNAGLIGLTGYWLSRCN